MIVARDRAQQLRTAYTTVRTHTLALCAPIPAEDCNVQSMPEASPPKWHLAHTTWFFDTFVLEPLGRGVADAEWRYLFNSYYHGVGERYPRARRGLMLRPDLAAVRAYRLEVDRLIGDLLADDTADAEQAALLELGLHHEQQHQELLLTDLKHAYGSQVLPPRYAARALAPSTDPGPLRWRGHPGGVVAIGHAGHGFAYDNESPRHEALIHPCAIAERLVTCGEYLAFIEDGGYQRSELWLDDGWSAAEEGGWRAPLYWRRRGDAWYEYTLHGERPIDPHAPVTHVSLFEADAYATWAGARLATEFEWEALADPVPAPADENRESPLHPVESRAGWFGCCWQWTRSAYLPYPGYRAPAGAVGEYNGKFMSGQYVLRGSSVATPAGHARSSYRHFFPPGARWQFTGIRLARDAT